MLKPLLLRLIILSLFVSNSFANDSQAPTLVRESDQRHQFRMNDDPFHNEDASDDFAFSQSSFFSISQESETPLRLISKKSRAWAADDLNGIHQNTNGECTISDRQIVDPPLASVVLTSTSNGQPDWHPLDTLVLFGGLEGSKQPQDFGVNANFGSRWAANWGFPLLAEYGLGAQVGTSINQTDNAVQVFERVGESSHRTQSFSTVGVFQRLDRWNWGFGYDFLYESYFDQFFLGQWRGRGGYAVTQTDEFGVWFTISQMRDSGQFLTIPVTLTPLSQGNVYWQHQFAAGTRTMAWIGVSEGHAQTNLALGDLKKTGPQFVFGAEVDVPLNNYFAIYGQANFISPADSGTVDSYLGLAYYPGGHAFPASRNPFAPLLALANSTMFATNLSR